MHVDNRMAIMQSAPIFSSSACFFGSMQYEHLSRCSVIVKSVETVIFAKSHDDPSLTLLGMLALFDGNACQSCRSNNQAKASRPQRLDSWSAPKQQNQRFLLKVILTAKTFINQNTLAVQIVMPQKSLRGTLA